MAIQGHRLFIVLLMLFFSSLAFADTRAEQAAKRVKPVLVSALEETNLTYGNAVFIRIFKAEKDLELWVKRGERFVLFKTYPICTFSGRLGPKRRQGDGQSPEGFYRAGLGQLQFVLKAGGRNVEDQSLYGT